VTESNLDVVKSLKSISKDIDELILWTDCDREGEAIGFEVVDVCQAVRPKIKILRAHFSALTKEDIERATQNLVPPNKYLADAVTTRSEIDLRIGASFTRLQTLSFKEIFFGNYTNNAKQILSYGPCQFPTLGFVVERY
jgi:DNA topoisomerase-3